MTMLLSTKYKDVTSIMRLEEEGCFLPSERCILLLSQQYGPSYAMNTETYFNESLHICDCIMLSQSIGDGLVPLFWGCKEDLNTKTIVILLYDLQRNED
jgi:hypothetical protein